MDDEVAVAAAGRRFAGDGDDADGGDDGGETFVALRLCTGDGAGAAMDEVAEGGRRPTGAVVSRPTNGAGDETRCNRTSSDGAFVAVVVVVGFAVAAAVGN